MIDEREKNLPKWVQEQMNYLRQQTQQHTEQYEELKVRNAALEYLLRCAARGGHTTAQQIVDVLGSYESVLYAIREAVEPKRED